MTSFIYNKSDPYEKNFQRWWLFKNRKANKQDFKSYGTDTEGNARKLFDHYFLHKKIWISYFFEMK